MQEHNTVLKYVKDTLQEKYQEAIKNKNTFDGFLGQNVNDFSIQELIMLLSCQKDYYEQKNK